VGESLDSRVAIVTGASRGIGFAVAAQLARLGATVALTARKDAELQEAVGRIGELGGGQALGIQAHAGRSEDNDRLVSTVMDRFGRIDILVNNAAANPYFGPIIDIEDATWDKTFEVNLRGTFFLTRAVVRVWMYDHGGVVVNVASAGGLRPAPDLGAYNVTKAGMIHLTRQLGFELGSRGIRVNCVAPGVIETRFSEALWKAEERGTRVRSTNPMGRTGTAEEVASAVCFLASDAASYINGEVLVIDGGGGEI
jgi:NAD(P)-dependent dehydrogenase (short-subunit alcohol dehydrogenase family)